MLAQAKFTQGGFGAVTIHIKPHQAILSDQIPAPGLSLPEPGLTPSPWELKSLLADTRAALPGTETKAGRTDPKQTPENQQPLETSASARPDRVPLLCPNHRFGKDSANLLWKI